MTCMCFWKSNGVVWERKWQRLNRSNRITDDKRQNFLWGKNSWLKENCHRHKFTLTDNSMYFELTDWQFYIFLTDRKCRQNLWSFNSPTCFHAAFRARPRACLADDISLMGRSNSKTSPYILLTAGPHREVTSYGQQHKRHQCRHLHEQPETRGSD